MHRLVAVGYALFALGASAVLAQPDPIRALLSRHQFDLAAYGREFVLSEVRRSRFVLIGGLHGDRETQAFVELAASAVEPRLVVTEMSPCGGSPCSLTARCKPGGAARGQHRSPATWCDGRRTDRSQSSQYRSPGDVARPRTRLPASGCSSAARPGLAHRVSAGQRTRRHNSSCALSSSSSWC
jgi:hypothetical protein